MKMLHFPKHTGLKPRRFDAYDTVCLRYYRSHIGTRPNDSVKRECEKELFQTFGTDDLDMDYTHGKNIDRHYRIETTN